MDVKYFDNQNDADTIISDRLDKEAIELVKPGENLDLSHLNAETKQQVEKVVNKYNEVFSTGTADTGKFAYFDIEFEIKHESKFVQPRRVFKKETIELIRPKIEEHLAAGIFEPATTNTDRYMSNLNAVSKPTKTDFLFGRADKELRKFSNITINKDLRESKFRRHKPS